MYDYIQVHLCMCVCTLFDSVDCSPAGFPVYGISQARIPEWVRRFPSPADLPTSRIEPESSALAGRLFYRGVMGEAWDQRYPWTDECRLLGLCGAAPCDMRIQYLWEKSGNCQVLSCHFGGVPVGMLLPALPPGVT